MTVKPNTYHGEKSMRKTWKKQTAIEGKHGGCLNCGTRPSLFPTTGVIAVGFGYAALHRDGVPVWVESNDDDELLTCEQAEVMAYADPEHDWRIVLEGAMSGRTYQRHGDGEWVLIEQNQGFA